MARFPDVPVAPGVPPLLRDPFAVVNAIGLLTADIALLFGAGQTVWGIYDQSGALVLDPDSITEVEYSQDSQVSDYQVAPGAFASYNKVATPFRFKVEMTKGGSDAERSFFLADIDAVQASTELYSVVMPDGIYPSVNVDHVDFIRKSSVGVGLLTIGLWLTEIRETGSITFKATAPAGGTTDFQSTAQPSGADPVNTGTVQPGTPTPSVSALSSFFE